ncbi:MAG: 2-keto-3-deoxy-L-rhamnonate aldolase [Desulfovibrio sp.]
MLQKNSLRTAFAAKKPQFGCFLKFCDADSAEMIGMLGYDFCIVDTEHASFAPRDITNILRACALAGMPCIIRTPGLGAGYILSVLDSGAAGIQVPNIDTEAQAREMVACAKYQPLGKRGFAPTTRAAGFGLGPKPAEYAELANETVFTVAHCESKTGAENLDAIVTVPGLDALFVGPMDMSQSFGKVGQVADPEVKGAIEGSLRKIAASGKVAGFLCAPAQVPYYRDLGVLYFILGTDQGFMSAAARNALDAARDSIA